MAENYKHLYEQMKKMLVMYQDEIVPGFRKKIEDMEKNMVEVVHGWWEYGEPDRYGSRKPACSVCGKYSLYMWSDHMRMNYCPNCGAKMDGEGSNE